MVNTERQKGVIFTLLLWVTFPFANLCPVSGKTASMALFLTTQRRRFIYNKWRDYSRYFPSVSAAFQFLKTEKVLAAEFDSEFSDLFKTGRERKPTICEINGEHTHCESWWKKTNYIREVSGELVVSYSKAQRMLVQDLGMISRRVLVLQILHDGDAEKRLNSVYGSPIAMNLTTVSMTLFVDGPIEHALEWKE